MEPIYFWNLPYSVSGKNIIYLTGMESTSPHTDDYMGQINRSNAFFCILIWTIYFR